MPEFTANVGASPFPDPNSLFNYGAAVQAGQGIQNNQLLMQGKQLDLSNANQAQVGQAAAGLLSAYPDEASRAAAYPRVVGMLQSQGFAKNAPAQYPGEGTLRAIVNTSVPIADQYKMGLITSPQAQANFNSVFGAGSTGTGTGTPTTAAPATTGTSATPSGPAPFVGANLPAGVSPDEDQLVRTVYGEARGEPVAGQQAVASVIKTRMGLGKQGVQDVVFAPNQFEAWSDPKNRPGMEALSPTDPQYQAILNNVVRPVMSGQAQDPTGGATNFYNPTLQAQLGRSTPGFAQGNQTTIGNHTFFYGGYAPRGAATATAQAAAAPAGGGGTRPPAPTQFAGPGAPPGSTAAPAPAPDTPWDLPGAPAPDLPPPSTPTATPVPPGTAPAQPQPAQPAPGPAPAQPTPGQAAQPQPTATGVNSPNFQRAMQLHRQAAMLLAGPGGQLPQNVAMANYLNTNADALLKVDNWVRQPDGTYVNTLTGQPASAPTPAENWVRQPDGTYINQPTGKPMALPPGRLINQPGVGVIQALPGGGAAVVSPVNPQGVQTQEQAKTSGAAAGTASVQLYNGIIARAQAAQKSEGDIDYASNQLAQAAKGGQTTGFFSPAMATAAAVAKSLGIDTTKLGVDPSTVGNIQSAQKTLAVLGASILQQALGKDSQITDAKIQAYEHTQPGIENDPQALQRIMAWARSQFTYERELGHAAATEAGNNGGILPPTFLPRYYANVGFAPVYDSVSGEMQQPDGRQPARETPPPVATPRVPQEGDTATGKDGHKIVLRGGNWVPQ